MSKAKAGELSVPSAAAVPAEGKSGPGVVSGPDVSPAPRDPLPVPVRFRELAGEYRECCRRSGAAEKAWMEARRVADQLHKDRVEAGGRLVEALKASTGEGCGEVVVDGWVFRFGGVEGLLAAKLLELRG